MGSLDAASPSSPARAGASVAMPLLAAEGGAGRAERRRRDAAVAAEIARRRTLVAAPGDCSDWDQGRRSSVLPSTASAPRRARQQRRHPPRPRHREHGRGRVGRRPAGRPQGPLRAHSLRGRALAGRAQGRPNAGRQPRAHLLHLGAGRQPGTDELRRSQGRGGGVRRDLRAGAGALRRGPTACPAAAHASARPRRASAR